MFGLLLVVIGIADAWPTEVSLTQAEMDLIVALHNNERQVTEDGRAGNQPTAASNPDLTWSNSLAASAMVEAIYKDNGQCYDDHTGTASTIGVGENLSWSSDNAATLSSMMDGWIDEKHGWEYSTPDASICVGYSSCGHYTQMIWAGTTQVGCAIVRDCEPGSAGSWIKSKLVCHYSPPGNTIGQYPFDCADDPLCEQNTPAPTASPTSAPSVSPSCYDVDGTWSTDIDGRYEPVAGYIFEGKQVYKQDNTGSTARFLFWYSFTWALYTEPVVSGNSISIYCSTQEEDPSDCTTWSYASTAVTKCDDAVTTPLTTAAPTEQSGTPSPTEDSESTCLLVSGFGNSYVDGSYVSQGLDASNRDKEYFWCSECGSSGVYMYWSRKRWAIHETLNQATWYAYCQTTQLNSPLDCGDNNWSGPDADWAFWNDVGQVTLTTTCTVAFERGSEESIIDDNEATRDAMIAISWTVFAVGLVMCCIGGYFILQRRSGKATIAGNTEVQVTLADDGPQRAGQTHVPADSVA